MLAPDRGSPNSQGPVSLSRHASEFYDDLRLTPMLRTLVRTSCTLADAVGGSISIVDTRSSRYTKVAELGTSCRLGQSFPLHEGVTGQVMSRRGPVVLRQYRELASGHLDAGHPAWDGAVAAIPIWWCGDIVAVNVIFAGVSRPFSVDEVDHLELVTQVVAPGLVAAIDRELPTEGGVRRSRSGHPGDAAGAVSPSGGTGPSVGEVTRGLLDLAQRAAVDRGGARPYLHVRLVGRGGRPRLLLLEEGAEHAGSLESKVAAAVWHELVDREDGALAVQRVAEADILVEKAPPHDSAANRWPGSVACPFSSREKEIVGQLARGLSDRAIAEELCLSPKTVEKHVSAVLRKTGTTSRTAAVVTCIQQGWLDPSTQATS